MPPETGDATDTGVPATAVASVGVENSGVDGMDSVVGTAVVSVKVETVAVGFSDLLSLPPSDPHAASVNVSTIVAKTFVHDPTR